MMHLFLDMDGVLMDFNRAMREQGVVDNETHFIHKPRSEWTPSQVDLDRRVREVMEREDFWPNIPPMPDAHMLWNWCRPIGPRILTATPNVTDFRDRIADQKRQSIFKCFDPIFPAERIHVCLRAEKAQYAPGNVLVDDMPSNCTEWNAAGGMAILHKDAFTTIRVLREIFGE